MHFTKEMIGLSAFYYPQGRITQEPQFGLISQIDDRGVASIAILPMSSGIIEVVPTSYHKTDSRLVTPDGRASEACIRYGCWELTEASRSFVAWRNSRKQPNKKTDDEK